MIIINLSQLSRGGGFWIPAQVSGGYRKEANSTVNAPAVYTTGEERANVLTHGLGVALNVAGMTALVTLVGMSGG